MKVVCNASPIIYLAKVGKLELLRSLFGEVIIPHEVHKEIVGRGKEEKFVEVLVIKKAVDRGWIKKKPARPDKKLLEFALELDRGEVEVISLSRRMAADLVLIDDASGRKVAESFGLTARGTLYVLLMACRKGLMSKEETESCLARLLVAGFRLSPELYSRVLEELRR